MFKKLIEKLYIKYCNGGVTPANLPASVSKDFIQLEVRMQFPYTYSKEQLDSMMPELKEDAVTMLTKMAKDVVNTDCLDLRYDKNKHKFFAFVSYVKKIK